MGYKNTLKRLIPESLIESTRPLRAYFAPQRRFDRRFGVDTTGYIEPEDLGTAEASPEETGGYEPTPRAAFARIVKSLGLDYSRYTFVDMGSGKGAVLLYAAGFPFKQIIGVEFSPALHAIAERNIEAYRGTRVCAIKNLRMNATDFEPPAGPTVFFFFNPFKGRTLETVCNKIERAVASAPDRDVLVIYYHTESRHPVFDRAARLEAVRRDADHTVYRARRV